MSLHVFRDTDFIYPDMAVCMHIYDQKSGVSAPKREAEGLYKHFPLLDKVFFSIPLK